MPAHPGRPALAEPGTSSGGWSRGTSPAKRPRDENRAPDTLVDATSGAIADAGSIPAVSTLWLRDLAPGAASSPEGPPALARPAIPDVRGQRRMQHLHRLHAEGLDAVEDPLAGPEQDRRDVERELVDDPGDERLPHGPGAPRDVHAVIAGGFARLRVGGVESSGDEMEGRPAVHLDRLVSVMGEHEHRSVVRRLRSPPPAPVLIPRTADRPEHVATHQVGAPRTHEPAGRRLVGLVGALVAQVPAVQLPPALAQRVLATLLWPGDEAVKGNRHVACGVRHQHLPSGCDLQAG